MRRNARHIVECRYGHLTHSSTGGVLRYFAPAYGIAGADRIAIMAQHQVARWRRDDIADPRAYDLVAGQSHGRETRIAHRQEAELAVGFHGDVKQNSRDMLVDRREFACVPS